MRTEVFIRQLQCKVETFLARKGTKSHISLSQNISNITFGKVQTVSLTLYLSEIQKLIRQVQQPFRIMLHDVQIFMSFRVQMLFQNDILQRSFYQCQRSADFMCYVRKEIYLGIINLTFFLLFELLKLAAVLPAATLLEIPESIYKASNKPRWKDKKEDGYGYITTVLRVPKYHHYWTLSHETDNHHATDWNKSQ